MTTCPECGGRGVAVYVVGALYGVIDMSNVQAAKDFASEMWLGEIMLGIVGFYFGGGLAESVKKK